MASKKNTPKKRTPPTIGGSKSTSGGSSPVTPSRKKSTEPPKKKNMPKKPRSSKKPQRGIIARLFKWTLVLGLWCFIGLVLILGWYARELPGITANAGFEKQNSITVLAADGTVLARYGEIKGNTIDFDELPQNLINAVLAVEDRRFYDHPGVDPIGLLRAVFVNLRAGHVVQGGSTLTQQLAKNLFLSHERTFKRKIQEAMLAIWLEHQLSKDEIITAYLNRVYLGSGAYGVDAASHLYFDKQVSEINLREAATLAGLFKAPSRYSPLSNPTLSKERADVVLQAMADAGYITKEQAKSMTGLPPRPTQKPSLGKTERYFTDWVVDGLDELIGAPVDDLIIETTLDAGLQDHAEGVLLKYLAENGATKKIGQGALLFTRKDGAVIAMIGGKNFNESQFNRTVQARRAAGSSFKPIVYLTALENGYDPYDMILDAPITEGKYHPENYDGKYNGEVTLIEALAYSLNTSAVRLMDQVGRQNVINTARRIGIISDLPGDLSLALGSAGVSMLEMTAAYGAISNGGLAVYPYAITKIRDSKGTVYYQRPSETLSRRVIDPRPDSEIREMLDAVVKYGTGRGANPGFEVAGKTGTSQESRDAWFIGFSDDVVGSVWLGNDDNSPMDHVTGGSVPARIWRDVMATAQPRQQGKSRFTGVEDDGGAGFSGLMGRLLGGGSSSSNDNNNRRDAPQIHWNSPRVGAEPNAHENNEIYNE